MITADMRAALATLGLHDVLAAIDDAERMRAAFATVAAAAGVPESLAGSVPLALAHLAAAPEHGRRVAA